MKGYTHVKDVFTLASEDGTIVPWDVTVRTASVKGDTTDSAYIVVRDIPFPYRHCVHSLDLDLHPSFDPFRSSKQGEANVRDNAFRL